MAGLIILVIMLLIFMLAFQHISSIQRSSLHEPEHSYMAHCHSYDSEHCSCSVLTQQVYWNRQNIVG